MTLATLLCSKKRVYDDAQTNDVPRDDEVLSTEEIKILKKQRSEKFKISESLSFRNDLTLADKYSRVTLPAKVSSKPESSSSPGPRPFDKQNAAALVLQKSYKSYRIRRSLADCAIVAEELWWRARAALITYYLKQPETAKGRWARAKFRAAKVGRGLSKDEKAQKLALRHWLEAIDPCHRYGHNLHFYYDVWFASESSQAFFYWLDIGDGKEVNLENCSRIDLKRQRIVYLGPKERKGYEVIIDKGKLVYKLSGKPVNTTEGSKWIFVLSTSRNLYVGQKQKGRFQHSSFLAGGAATAAGRLIVHGGVLEAIWPYSGHYHPTEENFMEFVNFLKENRVDMTDVKRCAIDDDIIPSKIRDEEKSVSIYGDNTMELTNDFKVNSIQDERIIESKNRAPSCKPRSSSCKWSTGAGPRISCVRDYPPELQFQALEQVKLSPRLSRCAISNVSSIPSPRPGPRIHLSPRIAHMGLPSLSVHGSSV